jgi:hypothetical protein
VIKRRGGLVALLGRGGVGTVVAALVTAIGTVIAAFVTGGFGLLHHPEPPPPSPPTTATTPSVCTTNPPTEVDNVPERTPDSTVILMVIVHCPPASETGNTYFLVSRFDYSTHSEWHILGKVSPTPGTYPTQYSPSSESKGVKRFLYILSCTSGATQTLSSHSTHDAITSLPSGCQLASIPASMTFG